MKPKKAQFFQINISESGKRAFFVLPFILIVSFIPVINSLIIWFENRTTDLFFTAKPLLTEKQTKHPVMILTKDQTFLERFGREPDRLDFALIINLLNKADTKVAAFDFIFDQPTEHPEKDQAFSNALKTFPFPLAAEHFLTRGKQTFEQLNLIDANYNRPPWPLPLFKQISDNIAAKGLINLVSDFDSTVRYVPLAFLPTEMKEFRPSLGYATWVAEIFATSFDKAFLTADQTTNLTAKEIIIKTLSNGPYKFKTTGHSGIDLMTRRLEAKFIARILGLNDFRHIREELKETAQSLDLKVIGNKTWLNMPEKPLPIVGSLQMPCVRINFSKKARPFISDGIDSYSIGTLLETKQDKKYSSRLFKPDITIDSNFSKKVVNTGFDWASEGESIIEGKVVNLNNHPMKEVYLRIEFPDSGFWAEKKTNSEGLFRFKNLPEGRYNLFAIEKSKNGWIKSSTSGLLSKNQQLKLPALLSIPRNCNFRQPESLPENIVEIAFFGEAIHLIKTDRHGDPKIASLPDGFELICLNDDFSQTSFLDAKIVDSKQIPVGEEFFALLPKDDTWHFSFYFTATNSHKNLALPGSLDCQMVLLSDEPGDNKQNSASIELKPGKEIVMPTLPRISHKNQLTRETMFSDNANELDKIILISDTEQRLEIQPEKPFQIEAGNYRVFASKGNLKGRFNRIKSIFRGRTAFIGTALPEDQDFVTTPINFLDPAFNRLPGVNIHAALFSGLKRQDFLCPVFFHSDRANFFWPLIQTLLVIPLLLLCNLIFIKQGAFWGALAIIFCSVSWLFGSLILFLNAVLVPAFFPIINIATFGVVRGYLAWAISRRKEHETRSTFGRFISSAVVDEILKTPDSLKPGGEKKELTIIFTDLAGFTTISEKLQPEQLTELMNDYLGEMTSLLFEYQGTLDKYIGDAIMAFWNHPKPQADHPQLAAECAIAMQKKLKELRKKWAKQGLPDVQVRAGINTATCMVGFIGSDIQMNFTCLGDGVNLASRLEGANKPYGTLMMISESVHSRLDSKIFSTRFLDYLAVKGKEKPIKVYELRGLQKEESQEWIEVKKFYDQAIDQYLARNWDLAIKNFYKVIEITKNDSPSLLYVKRCQQFKENPPPENWDGRFILKTK